MVPNILDKEKGHFVDINFIVQTHARTHTHTHTHTQQTDCSTWTINSWL